MEILLKGDMLVFSAADCCVIGIYSPVSNRLAGGHGGRDCLFDRAHLLKGAPPREPESIVQSLVRLFPRGERCELEAAICLSIGPGSFEHPWDHPQYGADNEKMCRYLQEKWGCTEGGSSDEEHRRGRINQFKLISAQLKAEGVTNIKVFDEIDTATDERLWSRRRGDKESNLCAIGRF